MSLATKRTTKPKIKNMTKAQLLVLVSAQQNTIEAMSRSLRVNKTLTEETALSVTQANEATAEMLKLVKQYAPVERRSAYGDMKDVT